MRTSEKTKEGNQLRFYVVETIVLLLLKIRVLKKKTMRKRLIMRIEGRLIFHFYMKQCEWVSFWIGKSTLTGSSTLWASPSISKLRWRRSGWRVLLMFSGINLLFRDRVKEKGRSDLDEEWENWCWSSFLPKDYEHILYKIYVECVQGNIIIT